MLELTVLFVVGYTLIALENKTRVEKSAIALVMGGASWILLSLGGQLGHDYEHKLLEQLTEIATIVFFLLAAMTIVEVIEAYHGFDIIAQKLHFTKKRSLLWAVSIITFFLSAILDNLATTLVMVAIIQRLVKDRDDFLKITAMIVVAANSGGAFSPIGDITTTMLWMGAQVTFPSISIHLFLPSVVSLLIPLIWISFGMKGNLAHPEGTDQRDFTVPSLNRNIIFLVGLGFLISVPVLKTLLHIPPYLSLLTGLGILWILTEALGGGRIQYIDQRLSLPSALRKIDLSSILFFIGILLAVSALQVAGVLNHLAAWLTANVKETNFITLFLGFFSSIFDNVPLVAGAAKMFPLSTFPSDAAFWNLLAYSAGTGGSILIIGSAAGITAMGVSKMTFMWYLKIMAIPALLGFLAGWFVYFLQGFIFPSPQIF